MMAAQPFQQFNQISNQFKDTSKAGMKRKFSEIKKPCDRLKEILDYMGYGKLPNPADEDVVKDYIFDLGLRKLVSIVRPGDSFEHMLKR